jgi:hypothetical protein
MCGETKGKMKYGPDVEERKQRRGEKKRESKRGRHVQKEKISRKEPSA